MHNFSPLLKGNRIKSFGDSMTPLLMNGDVVYFSKCKFKDIEQNDIIIFKKNNICITHRAIYKTKTYIVTKGDYSFRSDGKIYSDQIIGKVEKVKRGDSEFNPELFYILQSTVYLQQITIVKNLLEINNIEFVILKGLPLHLYFKKTHPRRLYADCDILIQPKDLEKVREIFRKLRYEISDTQITATKNKHISELNFFKIIQKVVVNFDIHLEPVFMMIQLNTANSLYSSNLLHQMTVDLLHNKKIISLDNEKYPILKPEFLIIYLSLHLFHHNYKGIFRAAFIHSILANKRIQIDWNICKNIIIKYKLEAYVYPVFLILNRYFDAKIPADFIHRAMPRNRLQTFVGEKMVSDHIFNDENRLFGGINRLLLNVLMSQNKWYKKITLLFEPELWVLFVTLLKKIVVLLVKKLKSIVI